MKAYGIHGTDGKSEANSCLFSCPWLGCGGYFLTGEGCAKRISGMASLGKARFAAEHLNSRQLDCGTEGNPEVFGSGLHEVSFPDSG